MAKKNSLTSALSASLENSSSSAKKKTTAGKVPAKATGQGTKPKVKSAPAVKAQSKVKDAPKKPQHLEKAKSKSISFYQSEFDKMSKVRQILTPHVDSAVNNTQVVRLALELLELNEKKLVKAYLALRERDGKPN